jgi:hypothetical protein
VLTFVLRRVREERIGLIVARRAGSAGALWPELRRGFGSAEPAMLVLTPLSISALNSLLGEHLSRPARRPLLRRIYEASGGNPLYALAIARALDDADRAVEQLPIPATLHEAIAHRLEPLDARAVPPLLAVAALRRPTIARVRAAVTGFQASDLDGGVRAAVIEVIGDRVRFTHPLLASVHYARAPAATRRAVHRRLAQLVDDAEERANHLALAAEGPDSETAATLERAAHLAVARGAPESAAELRRRSRPLPTPQSITGVSARRINPTRVA